MTTPSACKGLQCVFAEPGDSLPDHEFQDWYNNEHIPLRAALPGYGASTRFVQADGQTPVWCALYDIENVDYPNSDAVMNLAKTRSARETDVISRIAFFEMRVYALNESVPTAVSDEFAGYKEGKGSVSPTVLVVTSLDVPPEHEAEFHKWFDEEHLPLLRKEPGWLRTRRFMLADSRVFGALPDGSAYKAPFKTLLLHDYANPDGIYGPEWRAATSTPRRAEVFANVKGEETRIFKVYKTFK